MEALQGKKYFPETIDFKRHDGTPAQLRVIDNDFINEKDILEITRICNQLSVKKFVTFQYATGSNGEYTTVDAQTFVNLATEGREKGESISYLIYNGNDEVVGDIGLKFLDSPEPEIGYWSDTENDDARGFITNAVSVLCAEVAHIGYQSVCAYTVPENDASQAVLRRAGFEEKGKQEKELGGQLREVIIFQNKLNSSQ